MTEKEKYLAWYKDQQENHGLKDIRFTLSDNPNTTEENVYRELNLLNDNIAKGNTIPSPFSDRQLEEETYCGKGCECYKNPETNEFDKPSEFTPKLLDADFSLEEKIYKEMNDILESDAKGETKNYSDY